VGETVHLAQLDGGQVLYVDKRNATDPVRDVQPGRQGRPGLLHRRRQGDAGPSRPRRDLDRILPQQSFHRFTPAHADPSPRCARNWPAIRARGHAFDAEEHEPGIICVAVPILSAGRAACWARCR
jgi:IclR family transcriptional regulator, KDG regulon repressor